MEQIAELLMDCDQNSLYALLLIVELKTLTPFSTIFNTHAHQTSTLTLEKLVILD